jgi:Sulfotransferase family
MPNKNETLIFLHIPKAGGSTMCKILRQHYPPAETVTLDIPGVARFKTLSVAERGRYRLIQGHMYFGLHHFIPRASTYITLLRHPVERALSFYYYARRTSYHYLYPLLNTEPVDLKTLLARNLTTELRNDQTRMLAGDEWRDPERVATRATLELAQANLRNHFRVVGLLEEFDASLVLLYRAFGWQLRCYVKENVAKEKPSDLSLDAETRRLLEEANSLDLELYEYARKLFDEQCRAAGDSFAADLCHFRRLNRAYARSVPRFVRLLRRILPFACAL